MLPGGRIVSMREVCVSGRTNMFTRPGTMVSVEEEEEEKKGKERGRWVGGMEGGRRRRESRGE